MQVAVGAMRSPTMKPRSSALSTDACPVVKKVAIRKWIKPLQQRPRRGLLMINEMYMPSTVRLPKLRAYQNAKEIQVTARSKAAIPLVADHRKPLQQRPRRGLLMINETYMPSTVRLPKLRGYQNAKEIQVTARSKAAIPLVADH
ncbi:unnamed protein product, partial [Strongylus vulgaris]